MKRKAAAAMTAALFALTVGVAPAADNRPPVVLIVFDALPVQLLEDGAHQIDAERFPNFAALAREGTWYRNATTPSESTRFSVPALLDGRAPRAHTHETRASHPVNLFTLLFPYYRFNVWEEATHLCPCKSRYKSSIVWRLRHGRVERFRTAVSHIDASRGNPQLTFIHVFLPHEARQYLPDGRAYRRASNGPDELGDPRTYDNRFLTEQVEQRTLLQLEFVDRLVGELVAHMRRVGVWDRSLVAIVSDHGESFNVKGSPAPPFVPGQLTYRRAVTAHNIEDIAGIAMFVKYPGQRSGGIDDRFVRHTDLLPTILHNADVSLPGGLVGSDLQSSAYRGHDDIAVTKQDGRVIRMPVARWLARRDASNQRRLSLFGSGTQSIFAFGPQPTLLGVRVGELRVDPRGKLRAHVAGARDYEHVSLRSSFLPAQVFGSISGGRASGHTLAFALNGTIVATAPSFSQLKGTNLSFSAMLPPEAFRDGVNQLEVFEVVGDRDVRRL